jgi:hypothetical protein
MTVESILTPDITPVTPEQFELVDDLTVTHMPSQGRGVAQRVSFGDPRWRIKRKYMLRTAERAKLMSLLQNAQGGYATVYANPGYVQRGSFPNTELLTNPHFVSSTSGWTAISSSEAPDFTVADQIARLTRTGASNGYAIKQAITTVASAAYVGRGFFIGANDAPTYGVRMDTVAPTSATLGGIAYGMRIATTTSMNIGFESVGATATGGYFGIAHTSASRCALVDSGTWGGNNGCNLLALPTSTAGLGYAGDFISINGELKQLTAPINSNGSGKAYAQFRPALFRSPNVNDPVIFSNPMGKFRISELRWDNMYGLYNDLSLTLDEVYE